GLHLRLPVRRDRLQRAERHRHQVHALLRPAAVGHAARVRAGLPDPVDPVRPAERAAGARGPACRAAPRGRGDGRPAVRPGHARVRGELVMPPAAEHFVGPPHWEWYILGYFLFAGLSGGSYALAALLRHWGTGRDEAAARMGFLVAFPAVLICPVLLTLDLG